jgi:hypothetical protein
MPISESNYFVYDKYNYGVSPTNVLALFLQKENGEVITSEYVGKIYSINNTSIKDKLPNLKKIHPLVNNYFKLKNGIEYFCGNHQIIISKNSKIQKIITLNSQNDHSVKFYNLNDTIIFLTAYKNGIVKMRQFDGKKITTLLTKKKDEYRYPNQLFVMDKIYIIEYAEKELKIYKLENKKLALQKKYNHGANEKIEITNFIDVNNFQGLKDMSFWFDCKNGSITYHKHNFNFPYTSLFEENFFFDTKSLNTRIGKFTNKGFNDLFTTNFNSNIYRIVVSKETNSYYTATNTSLIRFFPHIKKYPKLFNDSNSTGVFALEQDNKGRIWAASYQTGLTMIHDNKKQQSSIAEYMYLNGSVAIDDRVLLFAEFEKGALLFDDINSYKKIVDSISFLYGYKSKNNKLYLGSVSKGLWITNVSSISKNKPIKWNIINEKKGLSLFNILTINEDKFGNIWMGKTYQGISVYNPRTNKAITWEIDKREINFGSMASVLDDKKTLWFGKNDGGLCYYDGKSPNDINVKNFKNITHPLLKSENAISFLKQWKNYLILGAGDKILLFDLKQWYKNKIVAVRYLNPQETNFSTPTEQNTCLIDKRDKSIWFATSDMVYQWDIKKWLTLPTFKVIPSVLVKKDSTETEFVNNKPIEFKPTENSFDIQINYQTKDNMPRFINGILAKKGEKPLFENPNLQTKFHFANLSSGDYVFYVRVCQQDGSFDVFEYPITIENFIWQNWWFWAFVSLLPIGFSIVYFKKRNQIEKQKKKLSQLNLSSLSNQFRPHFMLNALNSIGSQMEGKPHAEKVISRLGESINILYGFTQKNDFTISFQDEWKLVENSIEIQRLLFIPELKVTTIHQEIIPLSYKIPVGLLQIPIENALLHGLRNKTDGNCLLEINFSDSNDFYTITITDNGVGRRKSAEMNNFKTNGKGLQTVFEMIKIINHHQRDAINFDIADLNYDAGTCVKILLNKIIDYEKIKL